MLSNSLVARRLGLPGRVSYVLFFHGFKHFCCGLGQLTEDGQMALSHLSPLLEDTKGSDQAQNQQGSRHKCEIPGSGVPGD